MFMNQYGCSCQLPMEQVQDMQKIRVLSRCLDVLVASMEQDVELFGELFTQINGLIVGLENKWRN